MTISIKTTTCILYVLAASMVICHVVGEECDQEEFARCAKPLDMLHLTSEFSIGAAKKEELEKICSDLKSGIRCIQSYTRRCMDLQQRNEFNKLNHGTSQFIRDLCNKGEFQEEYLKHAACSGLAKTDFEVCAKEYREAMVFINPTRKQENISITDNIKTICCSLNELMDCLEQGARKNCGQDAGKFTRELVEKFVINLTKLYCEKYVRDPDMCGNGNSAAASMVPNIISIFSVLLASAASILR